MNLQAFPEEPSFHAATKYPAPCRPLPKCSRLKGRLSGIASSLILACSLSTTLALDIPDWKETIRQSQIHLAQAEPEKAEAGLIELERSRPEIRKEPLFCYQRFFVALEGRGDRATAKLMLQRLNYLVANDALEADSAIYRSVTETWYRSLVFTDSDLVRLAHKKMTERLAHK